MTDPLEVSPPLQKRLREWPEMGDVAVRMARETNRLLREQASGIVPEHVTRARAFVAEGLAMAHASADWHGSLSISHRSADQPDRDGYFTIAVGEKDLTPHAIEKLAAKLAATTETSSDNHDRGDEASQRGAFGRPEANRSGVQRCDKPALQEQIRQPFGRHVRSQDSVE